MKSASKTLFSTGRLRSTVFAWAAVFLSTACAPKITIPIGTVWDFQPAPAEHRLLIVYLPGNGDPPDAFRRRGLLEAMRMRGIPADVVGVNAVLDYYNNGSVFRRLEEDVIGPAKAKGYRRIWLVGNSLGGYGALAYLGVHREEIAGVVLLGPFAGDRETIEEIDKAGGLRNWDPGPLEPADWKRKLLLFLKDYQQRPEAYPPVYLGFGSHDRLAESQRFLATILPPERVIEIPGGHEWRTWRELWQRFLEQGIIK